MISFVVYGTPQPKGSTRSFVKSGKAITTSDNPKLKDWQNIVAMIAQFHRPKDGLIQGPVSVRVKFSLIRPKSVSVKKRLLPITKPDLDKLTRSVCDALKGTIYNDDSQVVELQARKEYGDSPGVRVEVTEYDTGL